MKTFHEHIICISRSGEGISGGMLWTLLEDFAKKPEDFIDLIERSTIGAVTDLGEEHASQFVHGVHFASGQDFQEIVRLEHDKRRYVADHKTSSAESRFSIEIVEPEEGALFLRFKYEEATSAEPQPDFVVGLRKQAYEAKDQDLAKRLRSKLEKALA